MQYTFPNQRAIKIHRIPCRTNFLGIQNEHWQSAARDLGAHALMLYLYLASNADGFELALSPAAIRGAIGMAPSTYRDQFAKLVDKGYLVQQREGSNIYHFYELPQRVTRSDIEETAVIEPSQVTVYMNEPAVCQTTANSREINNINIKDKIYNCGAEKQVSPLPTEKFVF